MGIVFETTDVSGDGDKHLLQHILRLALRQTCRKRQSPNQIAVNPREFSPAVVIVNILQPFQK